MNAYECYTTYTALKRHFTSTYDYEYFHGKIKATPASFEKRNDRYFFQKLAKRKDAFEYMIANFAIADYYIGDLLNNSECTTNYLKWVQRHQTLEYTFKKEIKTLPDDFNSWFRCENSHPIILKSYLADDISLEILMIIFDVSGALEYCNKRLENDFIWPKVYQKIKKYGTFFKFDKSQYKKILLECLSK